MNTPPPWDPTYTVVGAIATALGISLSADLANLSVAVVAAAIGASAWLVYHPTPMGRMRALVLWLTRIAVAVLAGGFAVHVLLKLTGSDMRLLVAPVIGWFAFREPVQTFEWLRSMFRGASAPAAGAADDHKGP